MPNQTARPFPLNLEVEFLDRLSEPVREGRAKSVSEIIRTALERFDFTNVVVMHPNQLQISVRLPVEVRRNLKKVSRSKHTSVGQLVRAVGVGDRNHLHPGRDPCRDTGLGNLDDPAFLWRGVQQVCCGLYPGSNIFIRGKYHSAIYIF